MITHNHELDMTPGGDEPLRIHLNKNDADFVLNLALFSSVGTLNIEADTTAAIRGTKGNGSEYTASATLNTETATVSVEGDINLTDEAGTGVFEICLTHNEKELYSSNFFIVVEQIPS